MKMGFVYRAAYPADGASGSLQYADDNFPGHAGWKEIVAVHGSHQQLGATNRSQRRVDQLSTDLLNSPPQDLSAAIQFRYPVEKHRRSLHCAALRSR